MVKSMETNLVKVFLLTTLISLSSPLAHALDIETEGKQTHAPKRALEETGLEEDSPTSSSEIHSTIGSKDSDSLSKDSEGAPDEKRARTDDSSSTSDSPLLTRKSLSNLIGYIANSFETEALGYLSVAFQANQTEDGIYENLFDAALSISQAARFSKSLEQHEGLLMLAYQIHRIELTRSIHKVEYSCHLSHAAAAYNELILLKNSDKSLSELTYAIRLNLLAAANSDEEKIIEAHRHVAANFMNSKMKKLGIAATLADYAKAADINKQAGWHVTQEGKNEYYLSKSATYRTRTIDLLGQNVRVEDCFLTGNLYFTLSCLPQASAENRKYYSKCARYYFQKGHEVKDSQISN